MASKISASCAVDLSTEKFDTGLVTSLSINWSMMKDLQFYGIELLLSFNEFYKTQWSN